MEKKKLSEDNLIWPFEFLTDKKKNVWKEENSEFVYLMALEKLSQKKNYDAKKLMQQSILLNPSERKYRETYLAFTTIIEKVFFKNIKLLQFKNETMLSYLIKVIRESLLRDDKIKSFSKLMIYCPSIDIFYSFCKCLFELNNVFTCKFYIQITKYIKLYLNKVRDIENDKWLRKLIKLYLELITHYQLSIKNKKLINWESEKEKFEELLKEDLNLLIKHSQYDEKMMVYQKILNVFYNFDQENYSLKNILDFFKGITTINQKLSLFMVFFFIK